MTLSEPWRSNVYSVWILFLVVLLRRPCFGEGHYENVALNKTCNMSSTWAGPLYDLHPRGMDLAVDGHIDTTVNAPGCVHTGYRDYDCYWEVNLGRSYSIHKMVSYGRTGFVQRMQNITVTVDGASCYTYPTKVENQTTEFTCTSGVVTGIRVRLGKKTSENNEDYAINLCEFQVLTCSDGYWGDQCDTPCGHCSKEAPTCNKMTGHCQSCQPGWTPSEPKCTQACSDGYWGDQCDTPCGHCSEEAPTCDKMTGHCESCQPGWTPNEPKCTQRCVDGKYGQDCKSNCSVYCTDSCNNVNGHCTCHLGYQPPLCIETCADYKYGQDCDQDCNANCQDVCNKTNGHCKCKAGWQATDCVHACADYKYGQDCDQDCNANCQDVCNKTNGHCKCKAGWQAPDCVHACADYKYGQNCDQDCNANCQDMCNKTNGHCKCEAGWQAPDCVHECTDGTYGVQCQSQCGNCSPGSTSCHHVTGNCSRGCQSGFVPPLCQLTLEMKDDGQTIGIIIGSVVGVIVIGAFVAIIFIIRRRRGGPDRGKGRQETLEPPSTVVNGNTTTTTTTTTSNSRSKKNASFSEQGNIYQNISLNVEMTNVASGHKTPKTKSRPVAAVQPKLKAAQSPSQSTDIYANSSAFSNLNDDPLSPTTTSPVSTPLPNPSDNNGDTEDMDEERSHGDVYYNDDTYMTSEMTQLQLDSVQQYLLDRLRAEDLDKEFGRLENGLTREHEAGWADENHYKNRFTSVVPYDDNRVVLRNAPHPGANDYINASFLKGWNSDKAYIASQGPRSNTMEDMWWMVWQEQLTHIVMLTSVMEADRKKCEEYWPGLLAQRKYGSVCVKTVDVQNRADYVIRTFDVKKASGGPSRKVTQYHFVTWPDHDVPSVMSLVDFWASVSWSYRSQRQPRAPLLVHCSAGVGRTGAFIALDSLMQQTQHSTSISVQQTAVQLRHDRCTMIQTKAQYRLVHEAALEAYTCKECRTTQSTVDTMAEVDPTTPNGYIDKQFQKLQQMKVLLSKPSHRMAEEGDNINKNRDVNLLPDDNHAVYLTYYVKGRNQFINAVYTPTFSRQRGCILTQLPLHNTVIDFWRLIAGNDVTTVVSLGSQVHEMAEGERYWPVEEGHSQKHGPFNVTLTSLTSLGQHLTSYHLVLLPEGGQHTELRLLHYTAWQSQLPEEVTDLLQLVCIMTEQEACNIQDPPLVLQCRDGATRSGLLRIIADVISRMTSDGHVDVYTAVKHVQNVRPQCVTSVEQYRYVYHVLQRYLQTSNVYQNT